MKPIITTLKNDPKTTVIGFDFTEDKLPHPLLFAKKFIQDDGYEIFDPEKKDRKLYDFWASRGEPETDDDPDVRFFKIQIVNRFYISPKGKVGAMCARRKLSEDQINHGVEYIFSTWDGKCAYTLEDIVFEMTPKVIKIGKKK